MGYMKKQIIHDRKRRSGYRQNQAFMGQRLAQRQNARCRGGLIRRWSRRACGSGFLAVWLIILMLCGSPGILAMAESMEPSAGGAVHASGRGDRPLAKATGTNWKLSSATVSSAVPIEEEIGYGLAPSANLSLRSQVLGDLWDGWNGDFDFPGEGTQTQPYQIMGLAHLMALSQAVSAGNDFKDTWFELVCDIDLSGIAVNNGNWNPIGWYRNSAELSGDVATPFRGHFDGKGNTIFGLKIINPSLRLKNIGLFGVIDGGSVRNLKVEADDIYGDAQTAVLVGSVTGSSVIYNVQVSGYVYANGDAGGVAGAVTGGASLAATIENCRADGIIVNSVGANSFAGGIAGNVQRAYLVDNTVITQNGDANRIQGKGYVGGIAGRMRESGIYNSYVNGTIGGNGSRAVGGIVGKYEGGNLALARMAGHISRTNNGSASREGTFVGTRESRHNFTYGTEKDSCLAYLFTNSAVKARNVFGSNIDGDNQFTESAHIGYWTDLERKYVTVSGRTETDCKDRYFYEELEDGIRYIVTQKLGREFTLDGYWKNLPFRIDHFAPGYMGEPVRGYLIYIPRVDAKNANGTYDTDVAVLTAISETGSSYYRAIDKDGSAAVVPGAVVTVTTAPKNTRENRYQMIVEGNADGGVKPPTYLNEEGERVPMNYVRGGAYSFIMPECDTQLNAEYMKVTTRLSVDPAETRISVTHTRSGDRKRPQVVTEVKNQDGILIARYIDGARDESVDVQPVAVHVEHNGAGHTADRTVRWSVDDDNLLENCSEGGYTLQDGMILPNLNSMFIQDIINREVQAQADNQYREKINNTIYTRYAVLTATTNPDTSVNNQPVYGNCRVAVDFQIIDNTTVRVEDMELNRNQVILTVTRKLTGSLYRPKEILTCSEPVVLTASLNPQQPFYKQVSWSDTQNGKIVKLSPSGSFSQDCKIVVNYDPAGEENPAWIQNIIYADRKKKAEKPWERVNGSGIYEELVTATSEDQTHGNITAECHVIVKFVTVDETNLRSGSSSGGSSGGGSSTAAATIGTMGTIKAKEAYLPGYVVKGTWAQNEDRKWMFTDGNRAYENEWAAVYNPYANTAAGQSSFDWFRFDTEGFMETGWYIDADGNTYYLHTVSDGTQGHMYTGWNWIMGLDGRERCYYFNEVSDGTCGALKRGFTAPDGSETDQDGAWTVDGVVQIRQ